MNLQITGEMLIGKTPVRGTGRDLRAVDPSTGLEVEPAFAAGNANDVAAACALAQDAFDSYRETTLEQRAQFLEQIATNILDLGPALIQRAMQESGLPQARLEGERGRTVGQLRLFAKVVRDGRWLTATLDSALPDRAPARPDLRLRKIGLGPVAVFGASNFPLAFSVAGGDTASALAAGCPVVVKAHSAHPGTSELMGKTIQAAVTTCGLHEGVFSMLFGDGSVVGQALISDPAIKAVGFTGSRQGGLALVRAAAQRREPIPVYAEMSSINPTFLLPDALATMGRKIGAGIVDSLTLGAGQFCTNPGLIIALEGEHLTAFSEAASEALQGKAASTMLTPGIHAAYVKGVAQLAETSGVRLLARGQVGTAACAGQAALFITDAASFLTTPAMEEEIFGASALIVSCQDIAQFKQVAEYVEGQLTGTVFMTAADRAIAMQLIPVLERKVGRILFNSYPTGVEVSHAMVHGGPFPATSDSRSTSVGASAIDRFLRPVSYQDMPADLMPAALSDENSLNLWRVRDGDLVYA